MPAVSTLVTGTIGLPRTFSRFHDRTRIEHNLLASVAEKLDLTVDNLVEHDRAALVADAAGVVRTLHAGRTGRFATGRNLIVLTDCPGTPRRIGLHHRLHRIRAR